MGRVLFVRIRPVAGRLRGTAGLSKLLFVLCLLPPSAVELWAQPGDASVGECVWVEVEADGYFGDRFLVTYPGHIGRKEPIEDFKELARWGNWTYFPPREGQADLSLNPAVASPSRYGQTQRMVDRSSGLLPWEVFGYVFRRFDAVHITFSPGDPFFYKGPTGRWQNAYADITVTRAPGEGVYGVMVQFAGRPVPNPAALVTDLVPAASASEGSARRPARWVPILAFSVAGALALGTVVIVWMRGHRSRARTRLSGRRGA